MEAPPRPAEIDAPELRLWLDVGGGARAGRRTRPWIASLVLHAVVVTGLMLTPAGQKVFIVASRSLRPIPLVAPPPAELTQTAPNREKVGREFDLESLLPRSPLRFRAPSATRPAAPVPTPALPEPPRIESSSSLVAPAPPVSAGTPIPPPQIQAEEKPKLAFEKVGPPPAGAAPGGQVAIPRASVGEAVRSAARSRGGGLVVGDLGEGEGGIGDLLSQAPSPGRSGSALELLSDPMGVDFKPYLIRLLSSVRRNWFAVMPESAKMGRRGRVIVQFAVDRDGRVPKLVIATPSGTDALDRAAVAGISASNPFPPLPPEFRGQQIRLQFTFSYNMPSR